MRRSTSFERLQAFGFCAPGSGKVRTTSRRVHERRRTGAASRESISGNEATGGEAPWPAAETGSGGCPVRQVQQRVLGVLFGTPGRSFYANEVIGLARSDTGAVQREAL